MMWEYRSVLKCVKAWPAGWNLARISHFEENCEGKVFKLGWHIYRWRYYSPYYEGPGEVR